MLIVVIVVIMGMRMSKDHGSGAWRPSCHRGW